MTARLTYFAFLFVLMAGLLACDKTTEVCDDPPCDNTDTCTTPPCDVIANCQPTDFDFKANYPSIGTLLPNTLNQPADNIATIEGIELGSYLFYDTLLSLSKGTACATCHQPQHSFSDTVRYHVNETGNEAPFNTMPLINLGFRERFFWNGRATSIEEAVEDAIKGEHLIDWVTTIDDLSKDSLYLNRFQKAFCEQTIKKDHIIKALSQFIRTLISDNAPFDYDRANITLSAGYNLFGSEATDCFHCHTEHLFSVDEMRNNGIDKESQLSQGFMAVTGNTEDKGKFIAPTLRNIALTPPYMHDGRFKTLEEVIDHYDQHVQFSISLHDFMYFDHSKNNGIRKMNLTAAQKSALITFLHQLTDTTFVNNPAYHDPR